MALTIETLNKHQVSLLVYIRDYGDQRAYGVTQMLTSTMHLFMQWAVSQELAFVTAWHKGGSIATPSQYALTDKGRALLQSLVDQAWDEVVPGEVEIDEMPVPFEERLRKATHQFELDRLEIEDTLKAQRETRRTSLESLLFEIGRATQ